MDSFEWNKVFGAVLAVLLLVMAGNFAADALFNPKKPSVAGYELAGEVVEVSSSATQVAAIPIAELLAKADPKKGESAAKKCIACHSFEKGGANKVGPNLWAVVNAPIARVAGFSYSAALKGLGEKGTAWTYDDLNRFLESPKKYAAGTAMGFAGITKPEERADVILFMRSMSDTPAALPQ
jgi:cytochrome c